MPTTEGIPGPSTQDKEDNELEMYFFMNLSILKSIIDVVGQCPDCKNNTVSVNINTDKKKGFAQEIMLECTCLWTHTVFSIPRIKDGKSSFDINLRTVMAFREIGKGLTSIETFCRLMNTTPPMTTFSYTDTINGLNASYTKAAEIKKLFDRLRDDTLLSKCLHGKTQNVNESLNGIIWTRCPKRVYVTKKTLEICVSSAVLEFNLILKSGCKLFWNKIGEKACFSLTWIYNIPKTGDKK